MEKGSQVSMTVIRRLPKYFRYLSELKENGQNRISSQKLSELTGFTASQIRQDLNHFGGFGQQGYGYNVEGLYEELGRILGVNRNYKAVIIGTGNLGQAIAKYKGVGKAGFEILSLFDRNPKIIGGKARDIEVRNIADLEGFIEENQVDIGIITIPKDGAQEIADRLVKAGIKGIWNFSPTDLVVPENIKVEDVSLTESILVLSYFLSNQNDKDNE